VSGYIAAQMVGALAGVATAHGMFDLPLYSVEKHLCNVLSQIRRYWVPSAPM